MKLFPCIQHSLINLNQVSFVVLFMEISFMSTVVFAAINF